MLNRDSRVIIINLGGIGDILLSQPSVRALKKEFGCSISMMVVPRVKTLVERWGFVDEVYAFSKSNILSAFNVIIMLRKEKYDIAVNMRTIHSKFSSLKMQMLLKLINAKKSSGRNTERRASFFNMSIEESEYGGNTETGYCNEQIRQLGIKNIENRIDWFYKEKDFAKIRDLSSSFIVVHPGADQPSKRWPVERYKDVVEYLLKKEPQVKVIISGSKSEEKVNDIIADKENDNIINLTGKTSLIEAAAIISKAKLLVTNDTGIMHMGATLNIPMIVIFGHGDYERYNPVKISENARVLYKGADCAPCEKKKCGVLKCLKDISVADVKEAVDKIIE